MTNLCVFKWNYQVNKWNLRTLHPGVTLGNVIENTGLDFDYEENTPNTKVPTEKEFDILREIDHIGYLRGAFD